MPKYLFVLSLFFFVSCDFDLPKSKGKFFKRGNIGITYEPPGFLPFKLTYQNGELIVSTEPKIKTPIGTFYLNVGLSTNLSENINIVIIDKDKVEHEFHLKRHQDLGIRLQHFGGDTFFKKTENRIEIDISATNLKNIYFCHGDCDPKKLGPSLEQNYLFKAKKTLGSSFHLYKSPNIKPQYRSKVRIKSGQEVEVLEETKFRVNIDGHIFVWWKVNFQGKIYYAHSQQFIEMKETREIEEEWSKYFTD